MLTDTRLVGTAPLDSSYAPVRHALFISAPQIFFMDSTLAASPIKFFLWFKVYDLVHGLESKIPQKCFNYKCSADIETYEDCIKHGFQCGSLVYCDKCEKSYKTRIYFNSHSCIGNTVIFHFYYVFI